MDTLQEAKKLEQAGFSPEQASAIIEIQWRSPSWVLRNLENSGFEREQALAILNYFWSVRNESLMRHPRRHMIWWGVVTALAMIGFYAVLFTIGVIVTRGHL
jgi:hypothetical protein